MATSLIVVGSLNTDIVASGLEHFPAPGEHVYGKDVLIGPGGKSRNIADMAAQLMKPGMVAMIGRTAKDPYGLWEIPLKALQDSGVNTEYIVIDETGSTLPTLALIAVDTQGNNQIIVLPGASNDFSPNDLNQGDTLFRDAAKNNGYMVITLECPLETVRHAIKKARDVGLEVIFDPGGITNGIHIDDLLSNIYLIKPNEHEAHMLTGIKVNDLKSAKQAAKKLMDGGVQNVLITVGEHGAYLFTAHTQRHIPIPDLHGNKHIQDETGCGDQTIATLCTYLLAGKPIEKAAEIAILSGALQFHKQGIQPVTKDELKMAHSPAVQAIHREEDNELVGHIAPNGTHWDAQTIFGYTFERDLSKKDARALVLRQGLAILMGTWEYYDQDSDSWLPCIIIEASPKSVKVARMSGMYPETTKTYLLTDSLPTKLHRNA